MIKTIKKMWNKSYYDYTLKERIIEVIIQMLIMTIFITIDFYILGGLS